MNKSLEQTKNNLTVRKSISKDKIDANRLNNFDPKILDLLVVLNHLGFQTFSSCEGHPEQDKNYGYSPFIVFCNEYSENSNFLTDFNGDTVELIEESKNNLRKQEELLNYLNDFYKNRNTPLRYRLKIKNTLWLRASLDVYFRPFEKAIDDKEQHKVMHSKFIKEIDDFTEFLKTKI
jgi:hypothetical protein